MLYSEYFFVPLFLCRTDQSLVGSLFRYHLRHLKTPKNEEESLNCQIHSSRFKMRVLVSVTAAVVLALNAGSADAQTAPWTSDDLIKATSLGDASKCYYGLWTGKACAYGSSGGVYLIDQNWYARARSCMCACACARTWAPLIHFFCLLNPSEMYCGISHSFRPKKEKRKKPVNASW